MSSKSVPVVAIGMCAVAAVVALIGLLAAGYPRHGVALAAGLVIGSANGIAATRALESPVGFRFTSLLRLAAMTLAALAAAYVLGLQYAWLVLLGVAGAQLVLAGVAARSLLRR